MRRNVLVLVACASALAAAACGSKGAGRAAPGTGAEIAPAGSLAFVSVDVEQAIGQWRTVAPLLDRATGLTGLERLRDACLRSLSPALGKTVGVAVLGAKPGSSGGVVVITRPADMSKAKRALVRGLDVCPGEILAHTGARPKSSGQVSSQASLLWTEPKTSETGGWLLVSGSRATLDRFEHEAKKGTLAVSGAFRAAFATLPASALMRAYFSRAAVSSAVSNLAGAVPPQLAAKIQPDWVALAARPVAAGFRLDGAVSGVDAINAPNSLLGEAPATSRFALSFNGSSYGLDEIVEKLSGDAKTGPELAQVERYLGLKPAELAALARGEIVGFASRLGALGENAIAIDPHTGKVVGYTGFGLELRDPGAANIARKIEKGMPALAALLKGGARRVALNGVGAEELTIGALRFVIAGSGGKMFLSTDEIVAGPGPVLASSAAFSAPERALRIPARNAGVLFADLAPATGTSSAVSPRPSADRLALLVYLDASRSPLKIRGVLVIG